MLASDKRDDLSRYGNTCSQGVVYLRIRRELQKIADNRWGHPALVGGCIVVVAADNFMH